MKIVMISYFCNGINILSKDIKNINFDGTNYDKVDAGTIIHIRILA